jgi:hypothetical protein
MGVLRSFTAQCDKCSFHADQYEYSSATELRKICKINLWTISGNKFTCPVCNKNDLQYQRDHEMLASS